jgi:HEAT repeat protein
MKPNLPLALGSAFLVSLITGVACQQPGRSSGSAPSAGDSRDAAPGSAADPLARIAAVVSSAAAPAPRPDVMESRFCAGCHPTIYAEHEQSTHGRAFTDAEVRLATGRFSIGDCIVCHTPRPIFETGVGLNPTRRHHGLTEGNTCMTCHFRPDYDYQSFTGGAQCKEAFHPDVGTVEACASCHRNHGTPYQWEKSPTGKVTGRICMDCHMAESEREVAVGGPVRPVRTHLFPGSRSESQVNRAYDYSAAIDGDHVVVTVKNKGAGHNFPTELKQRAVESLVVVRDLEGNEVARSRMTFRDPYKRPYGLELPVNTQIPGGQSRQHRVPLPVAGGTVETTLFFKLYYPIDDYHPDLSRVLESRALPFSGITPSSEEIVSAPEVKIRTPEGIPAEQASPPNLVDYAHPPIGTVEVDIPAGESAADIEALIALFQFPVPQANGAARKRLVEIGKPAVPALIRALGSWDNKTYNQSMGVLEKIGKDARPEILAALDDDELYVRLHARDLVQRLAWRGDETRAALERGLRSAHPLDRASAAEALGELDATASVAVLRPLLGDRDPDVVRETALALAKLGAGEAVAEMEAALERAYYPETRRDLAYALARLGSTAGMHELLAGLDFPDDLVRERAFELFHAVTGQHMGYDPLAPRPDRQESLAALLDWWSSEGSAEALLPFDPDRDPFAEADARKLVADLGGNDLGGSTEEADAAAEETLVAMGKYAVPALIDGLKYPPGFADKRARVCHVLGRIGDRRAAPVLVATLRDPVVSVAAWACWALEGQADPATVAALARYEQRLRTLIATGTLPQEAGPGDRLLVQVARSRLAAGDPSARHTLATMLLSRDDAARRSAFDALQRRFGETRGYDPENDAETRRDAALRWMD